MKVTKLNPIAKNRIQVVFEDDFSFVLYKGEVRSFKIVEGEELSDSSYREIIEKVLPKRATLRAMNLLKVRPYTVSGLTQKLHEGGYPDSAVSAAIEYVSSYHYLDDLQYAIDYINTYKDRKSCQRIMQDLKLKGISKADIENALAEEWDDEAANLEEEQIRSFLKKKGFDSETSTYEEKAKILSSLYRKGFSVEMCRKIMGDFGEFT